MDRYQAPQPLPAPRPVSRLPVLPPPPRLRRGLEADWLGELRSCHRTADVWAESADDRSQLMSHVQDIDTEEEDQLRDVTPARTKSLKVIREEEESEVLLMTELLEDGLVPPCVVRLEVHRQATISTTYLRCAAASGSGGGGCCRPAGCSPHRRRGPSATRSPQLQRGAGGEDGFATALARHPPALPPALLRRLGSRELSGLGKVKVMLKVCDGPGQQSSEESPLTVDGRRRQVTLVDPAAASTVTPEDRKLGVAAPKMFAFDAIFSQQEPMNEICSTALSDVIQAVLNGSDGCLFTFGHSKLGKSRTMLGRTDRGPEQLGVIPCAISWLYRCIAEQKQRTGARFSVRVSAVEVAGPLQVNDLLAHQASESEQSPSLYLCEGSLAYSELRAPSPEKAGHFLDSALSARSSQSHLFYTLHVYQYSVSAKGGAVAGGRSRLHLIDLSGYDRTRSPAGGMSLSAIGNVLLAIFNGQKHIPHREQRLSQQLKECLGSLTCHVTMIAHVSPLAAHYAETLSTVQFASRIHRMRRKRFKFPGGGGGGGGAGDEVPKTGSEVDPSSSEQSADTVIYVGPSEETDGEHPPVYIPSLNSGDNRCVMSKALRGSLVEQKLRNTSRSVPASPQRSAAGGSGEERERGAGLRSGSGRSPKQASSSARSSPVRRPSEEQWVDGPRILKPRTGDGRQTQRRSSSGEKRETWVDGPKGYGFMDTHKKNMIRKWVENQSQLALRQFPEDGLRGRPAGEQAPNLSQSCLTGKGLMPLERLECSGAVMASVPRTPISAAITPEPDYEEEEMEVEIVEVEEFAEPVPMQDSCLQVTEEDIALCMGELENPLPEVDQEEHPLRILSQENLTVVSTLADSICLGGEMEKTRAGTGSLHEADWHNSQADVISSKLRRYEECTELALEELYGGLGLRRSELSRCHSLMFSELITIPTSGPPSDADVTSIASEPPYLPGENGKFCDNCKVNLDQNDDMKLLWQKQELARIHSFRNYSSLRHPDGASNPNIRESCRREREPGSGAEEERGERQEEDEEEEAPIPPPPPLQASLSLLTINRDGFDNMKSLGRDGQDLRNGQIHDTSGKGQYCKTDVERLEQTWKETVKSARFGQISRQQGSRFVKAELASARHRLFSPLYVFSSCISRHNCKS